MTAEAYVLKKYNRGIIWPVHFACSRGTVRFLFLLTMPRSVRLTLTDISPPVELHRIERQGTLIPAFRTQAVCSQVGQEVNIQDDVLTERETGMAVAMPVWNEITGGSVRREA